MPPLSRSAARLRSLASRPRVRGGAWILVSFGARIALVGLLFLLLARTLGADGFGTFAAAAAAAAIAGPFVAWGTGNLLIQDVSRRPEVFHERWGKALVAIGISGIPIFLLVVGVAHRFLGDRVPLAVIACVGAADLLFGRTLDVATQAYQAMDRLRRVAQLQLLPNIARLAAGLLFVYGSTHHTVQHWAVYYLVSTVLVCVYGLYLVVKELGAPRLHLRGLLADIRTGYHFSVSLSAQSIYNDIDKTMLARMATTAAVGTYAAAYRIIDVAFTPIRALLFSTYSQFFRSGEAGVSATAAYARRLLPAAFAYSVGAGLAILLAAPLAPLLLGPEFSETADTLRWLAVLPLLKSLHYLAADTLTGAGFQPVRSRVQVVVALVNIAANFVLIPMYSWRGAAWASVASDALLAIVLWLVVLRLIRSHQVSGVAAPPALSLDEA
jgi:O-antigen/teichoic acid export membrane protein